MKSFVGLAGSPLLSNQFFWTLFYILW
jgi:hypothetical protein